LPQKLNGTKSHKEIAEVTVKILSSWHRVLVAIELCGFNYWFILCQK